MREREVIRRNGDISEIPYTPDQIAYLEDLPDAELLQLIGDRYNEVNQAEALAANLRDSLRLLVLYLYKARPAITIAELARRTGLKQTSIYETYLGDGRSKRRKKPQG